MDKPKVTIYTDGACSNNPGKGGYGAILMFQKNNGEIAEKKLSRGFNMTTNNRMELLAVVDALNCLKTPCEIELYTDSKYVVEAINQKWLDSWQKNNWKTSSKKAVKNIDLWQKYLTASKEHSIKFIWVKGHNENKYNELCDKLAVEARNKTNLEEDSNFNC